jgi:SAM-dependent methyltransferase
MEKVENRNYMLSLEALLSKDDVANECILLSRIKKHLEEIKEGGVILDAGCGTGRLLNRINSMTDKTRLVGFDLSAENIKIAKKATNKEIDFIVADIAAPPLMRECVSMIVITNVFHHLRPIKESIHELLALLNPSGIMLIDDKISGNPLYSICELAYYLIPLKYKMKLKEKGEHVDSSGRLPYRSKHKLEEYIDSIECNQRVHTLTEVEYHSFFLFLNILKYVSYVFPWIRRIFAPAVLQKLYLFEKRIKPLWSAISIRLVVNLEQQKE